MHRKEVSNIKAPKYKSEPDSSSKNVLAATTTPKQTLKQNLIDQVAHILKTIPQTPLYATAPVELWLKQTWSQPVLPHTPAWTLALEGHVSPRDLVALMLAIWADSSVKHPSRYLSWLIQRWQTTPHIPPVENWEQWCQLAELPVEDWFTIGRKTWIEISSRDKRMLPFGLEILAQEHETEPGFLPDKPETDKMIDLQNLDPILPPKSNGLDVKLGDTPFSARDIWRATMGQLSLQLNRSTYTNWVEGAQAVSYSDGVLTVQVRHNMAKEWLAKRLNHSIESTVSLLAKMPIKVCYIVGSPVQIVDADSSF